MRDGSWDPNNKELRAAAIYQYPYRVYRGQGPGATHQLLPDAWSTFPQHLYRQSHRLKQCSSIVSFVNAGHSRVCSLRIATPRKPPKIQQGMWAGSPRSRPASYLSTLKSHHASQNVRAPFWWMGLAGLRRAVLFGRACDWCFRAT